MNLEFTLKQPKDEGSVVSDKEISEKYGPSPPTCAALSSSPHARKLITSIPTTKIMVHVPISPARYVKTSATIVI